MNPLEPQWAPLTLGILLAVVSGIADAFVASRLKNGNAPMALRIHRPSGHSEDSRRTEPARCAMDDSEPIRTRSKRFVPHKKKWRQNSLRWRLRDPFKLFEYKSDFKIVREVLAEGFRLWSKATQGALNLVDVTDDNLEDNPADLDIFFALKDHGDHEPFDDTGGIVAHTGYPMEGKMHFDGAEFWTLNSENGIDFRYVALHEIGHALGLRHSHHNASIMYPIYRRADGLGELGLHRDDVTGIRYLYSARDRRIPSLRSKLKAYPGGYMNELPRKRVAKRIKRTPMQVRKYPSAAVR